jgi:hypothetical protein
MIDGSQACGRGALRQRLASWFLSIPAPIDRAR